MVSNPLVSTLTLITLLDWVNHQNRMNKMHKIKYRVSQKKIGFRNVA